MTSIIQTEHLSKYYGKSIGIDDVTFDVQEGEIFGFLGPNGAGKTTTIRTLLGFMFPTSGHVSIFGKDAHTKSTEINRDIGYLPGELSMYRDLTGQQALAYLAYLRGGVDEKYLASLANRLESDLSKKIRSLSSGNKRKIGLIQALMHRPRLLIFDEPTSGLDPLVQQEFFELVAEAKQNGQTVFVSSHNLPEVEHICDRVGFIRAGKLIAIEDVAAVKAKSVQHIEIHFAETVPRDTFAALPGIKDMEVDDRLLRCTVGGDIDALIKTAARFHVTKFVTHEPHLEDVFMTYYETQRHEHEKRDASKGLDSSPR
jgi:ABC-2 type transport system ATP-binding protein